MKNERSKTTEVSIYFLFVSKRGDLAECHVKYSRRSEHGEPRTIKHNGKPPHLTVGRGKGDLKTGSDDDHDSGTELDRKTTGGGDLSNLHADGGDDLVTVESKTHDDTNTADSEDPEGVVSEFTAALDHTGGVNHIDGSEGAHGVGNVVRAVREGIADSGKDLHVLEGLLRARVELLGIAVDGGHVIGVLD